MTKTKYKRERNMAAKDIDIANARSFYGGEAAHIDKKGKIWEGAGYIVRKGKVYRRFKTYD